MTAGTVETAREGGGDGDGLRGSRTDSSTHAASGDIMARRRPDCLAEEHMQCLLFTRSPVGLSERPAAVVGRRLSRKSRMYQALRGGDYINNGDYFAKSTLMGIMARESAYTGQEITWEQMENSQQDLVPDDLQWNAKLAQGFIRKALPQAEKMGIRLLVENVRDTFLKEAEEMARFIDELKSPLVGAYFGTGNAITWTDQSAEHWARALARRIVNLDIKDRGHAELGDPKTRSKDAVGTDGGGVHWKNVRKELARIDFGGWATAEVKGGDSKRLAGIARWMEYILRI